MFMYCNEASSWSSVVLVSSVGRSRLYLPSTVMVWYSPLSPHALRKMMLAQKKRNCFIRRGFSRCISGKPKDCPKALFMQVGNFPLETQNPPRGFNLLLPFCGFHLPNRIPCVLKERRKSWVLHQIYPLLFSGFHRTQWLW